MTTALILYGSNVASSTLSSACVTPTTTGGSETTATTTAPLSGDGYLEIYSQGGAGVLNASLPTPSGKGWLFDSTVLEGQSISAGAWSATVAASDPVPGPVAGIVVRAYKRTSAGVYSLICTLSIGATPFGTTRSTFTLSTTSASSVSFATGDKLYFDLNINATGWASDPVVVYESSSATAGVASDMQVTTPGYAPTTPFVVTNAGLNMLVNGASAPLVTYVALGTSSTTPTAADTQLGAEVFRKAVSSAVAGISPGEMLFSMYLAPGDAVGVNIAEVGFFGSSATGAANSGTLIAHGLYTHTKSGVESIQVQFDFTV
jgi:hypothetical protein